MLACAKIGAIHPVVFAGSSATSLATWIVNTQAKLVITDYIALEGLRLVTAESKETVKA